MVKKLSLFIITLGTLTYLTSANALSPTPFSIKNLNPFIHVYGIPPTQPAELKTDKSWAGAISFDLANNSVFTNKGSEEIILDGETYRLAATFRHGLGHNSEIGFEIPLIAHSNGFLDNFIEGWHDFFGFSNSQRNKTPSNKLHYEYAANNITQMGFDTSNEGIGDIRIFAAKQLNKTSDSALSLHASLELPTGDAQLLHGSGAIDVSVSVAHIKRHWLTSLNLTTFVNGGLSFLGNGDVLPDIQKNVVGFGSAGLIWDNRKKIDFKIQFDFHSSVYNSNLNQLGNNTLQLTVGGSVHFNPRARLDIGVGENLLTDTTPDFLVNLALKYNY